MKRGIVVLYVCMFLCISGCGSVEEDVLNSQTMEGEVSQAKQVVTIGKIEGAVYEHTYSELQVFVDAFNESSENYRLEYLSYDEEQDLKLALIRGEGPDLFDFGRGGVDISVLANKGVLQDLSSYFEGSDVIKEDNLVDSIRRASTMNDQLVCVFPNFMVLGLLVKEEYLGEDAWTLEKYISLAEEHPNAIVKDGGAPSLYKDYVLDDAMYANMNSYIDFSARTCSFDSEEFQSLVRRVQELPKMLATNIGDVHKIDLDAIMNKFLNGEILTHPLTCGGLEGYIRCKEELGNTKVAMLGYPHAEGIPYYSLSCPTPLGMNAASENKDGAWAFLEFILSKEVQESDWLMNFPVREDSFTEEIEKTEGYRGFGEINLSREDRDYVRYMVDNAYWFDADSAKDVWYIISEELQPVWLEQKSIEDATDIIQSRISLWVVEQCS